MRLVGFRRDTEGAVAAITAIVLTVAVGAMSLAIDLGHIFLVRCELQRAADAGAMAGALALLNVASQRGGQQFLTPNCSRSLTASQQVVAANTADGGALALPSNDVIFGRWDTAAKTFVTTGCGNPNLITAVKVITRKDNTANGPVPLSFSRILPGGMADKELSAEAVALTSGVGGARRGAGTFPLAVDEDKVPPNNAPFRVHLNPTPGDEGCWHTYKQPSSGARDLRDYIDGSAPSEELQVGDQINVKEGVADSVLQEVGRQLTQRLSDNQTYDVLVPVIPANSSHSGWQPVLGFAALRITSVETQGGDKYIEGYVIPNYVADNDKVMPGGPNYGTYAGQPTKMVL